MLLCTIQDVSGSSLEEYVWQRLKTFKKKKPAPKDDAITIRCLK